MRWHDWVWWTLIYLLAGQIFSLVYCMVYRAEKRSAWLGLMGLFFPLYLILDVVITLASGLGAYSRPLLAKLEAKEKGK